MALHFDPETHTYTLDGKRVPSVTQIIRPLEEEALSRIPTEALEWKRALGTAVHLACQLDDEGDLALDTVDERITGYVQAWRNFKNDSALRILINEQPFASRRYRYAGTIDRVGVIANPLPCLSNTVGLAVIDLKTRVDLPDAIGVQLAGYKQLLTGDPTWAPLLGQMTSNGFHRVAVQLRADGTYGARIYNDIEDQACFTACLALHHWKAKRK